MGTLQACQLAMTVVGFVLAVGGSLVPISWFPKKWFPKKENPSKDFRLHESWLIIIPGLIILGILMIDTLGNGKLCRLLFSRS